MQYVGLLLFLLGLTCNYLDAIFAPLAAALENEADFAAIPYSQWTVHFANKKEARGYRPLGLYPLALLRLLNEL